MENEILRMYEQRASDVLRALERDNIPFSFEVFEAEMWSSQTAAGQPPPQLVAYTRQIADELALEGRHGNSLFYRNLSHLFALYKPKTTLGEITPAWLSLFEHYQRAQRRMQPGGIAANMRTLRAVCNRAIKADIMRPDWYPFKTYSLAHLNQPTPKRAIPLDDVRRIQAAKTDNQEEALAQDLFTFSLYARGMNLVDIAHLRPENVQAGRIEYVRRKTHQPYSIALNEHTRTILEKYALPGLGYCFPILSDLHQTAKQQQERIHRIMVQINRALRTIAARTGVPAAGLSFYTARHTYATALKERGVNTAIISQALGHTNLKTTEIYLKQFDRKVIDDADQVLL